MSNSSVIKLKLPFSLLSLTTKTNDQPIALNKTLLVVWIFRLKYVGRNLPGPLEQVPINAANKCRSKLWVSIKRCSGAAACIKCYYVEQPQICKHSSHSPGPRHGLRSNKISNQIISNPTRPGTNPATVNTFWIRIANVPPTSMYSSSWTLSQNIHSFQILYF